MPPLESIITPNQAQMLEALRPKIRFDGGARYRFHGDAEPKRVVNELPVGPARDGVATLRLYDPIDSWGGEWGVSAKEFTAALDTLGSGVNTIQLHLNSPGGEVFEAIAILNALRSHPARVVGFVDGIAASAASFIAAGCDELVMGRNSELMIHDARGICMGSAADMTGMASLLNHLSDNIAGLYAAKTGGTLEQWRATMTDEAWFSAEEAVAAGLADRIAEDAPQPTNSFDLSMFAHPGRASAPAPKVPQPRAAANDAADANVITQALGWFSAIDSIVDEAQESLAAYLEVPNPDTDDDAEEAGEAAAMPSTMVLRHRLNARKYDLPA